MYTQKGNYVAIAGLVVMVLNHFNVNVVQSDVEAVIGAGVIVWGVVAQFIAHKKLAVTAGAIPE